MRLTTTSLHAGLASILAGCRATIGLVRAEVGRRELHIYGGLALFWWGIDGGGHGATVVGAVLAVLGITAPWWAHRAPKGED